MNTAGVASNRNTPCLPRSARSLLLALISAAALLAVGAVPASAASPIEGVWSFNGGKVAVQAQPDGTLVGTVVAPTKFSECFHPVGERMWTEIRPQPDGSYWGFHQWYFEGSECIRNPEHGLTAWRVVTAKDGSKSLEVCFSAPGSQSQPTIPSSGGASGATFGCSTSARISTLPAVNQGDAERYLLLPGNGLCLSRAKLRIRLRNPVGDPIAKAVVRLKSGQISRRAKLKRRSDGIVATLNLRGLTKQKFKVTVRATTVLGAHLAKKRSYSLCGGGPSRRKQHKIHHA